MLGQWNNQTTRRQGRAVTQKKEDTIQQIPANRLETRLWKDHCPTSQLMEKLADTFELEPQQVCGLWGGFLLWNDQQLVL